MQFFEVLFHSEFKIYDKRCVVLSQTTFGTLKYDCVIKTIEMFNRNRKQFSYYWI